MFDDRINRLPPGPELAAALAGCDTTELNGRQLLRYLRATQRQQAWTEGLQLDAVAEFADRRSPESEAPMASVPGAERGIRPGGEGTPHVLEFTVEELSAELGMSSYRAGQDLADALDLRHRLPRVAQAISDGRVDGWRGRLVARGTRALSPAACMRVEGQVLGSLDRVTSRRVERLARAAALAEDPESTVGLEDPARSRRRVDFGPIDADGNRELWAVLTAADAVRLDARVRFVVDLLRDEAKHTGLELSGDTETLRARALGLLADPEVVLALHRRVTELRGGSVRRGQSAELPQTTIYLHLRPDELAGNGAVALEGNRTQPIEPVPRAALEDLLGHSNVTIRPVIDLDHMAPGGGYAFTGDLREAVVLANPTCVFPFCDRPARTAQIDHTIEYPRGPTTVENGGPTCERHHRVKTHGRWRLSQPFNGIFCWYAPTGHVYVVDDRSTLRLGLAA